MKAVAAVRRKGVSATFRRAYEIAALKAVRVITAPLRRPSDGDPYHEIFRYFVEEANKLQDYNLLELGSRNRVGDHGLRGYRKHVGVDVNPGDNVHVVGDAHKLSQFLDERFDVVYSISVFEHLAMPWKAVLEINRILNPGGLVFVSTHPCWPAHALPWDFWRYQAESFKALFNEATGFAILRCSEGLPARILPMVPDASTRGLEREPARLGVAVLARKISEPRTGLAWDVDLEEFLNDSYPESGHSYL